LAGLPFALMKTPLRSYCNLVWVVKPQIFVSNICRASAIVLKFDHSCSAIVMAARGTCPTLGRLGRMCSRSRTGRSPVVAQGPQHAAYPSYRLRLSVPDPNFSNARTCAWPTCKHPPTSQIRSQPSPLPLSSTTCILRPAKPLPQRSTNANRPPPRPSRRLVSSPLPDSSLLLDH
jgi:hypothetical protein